ncbi:TetR/AcrR family transcriptional regulator [Martelella alba]|uniref:TetR/AcrR family transcriptional regulator n=1 Tax=Martelella alba TaxID=2590451 RepID=A0ABY2SUP7_9HYPH|nr:TetR/AcrR family transcriptional regulator [Martelella alba]TKI08856.1 TetR/AcrR family transcriptional regulator [Martelella alba]
MARMGRPREFDRDKAVDKAMNLFWQKGFESASLADLRQTLQLSSASFYAAFGSKQALYKECLERYTQSCGEVASVLNNESLSPKVAMQTMLHKTIAMQTSPQSPAGCMAVLSGLNCDDENKEIELLAQTVRQQTRDAVRRCVVRGIEQGEFSQSVNPDEFTLLLDCFIKGIAIEARDGVTEATLCAAADKLLVLWR